MMHSIEAIIRHYQHGRPHKLPGLPDIPPKPDGSAPWKKQHIVPDPIESIPVIEE